MLELETMTVPLDDDRVVVRDHRQMDGVKGLVDRFITPPSEQEDPTQVALDFGTKNPDLVGDAYDFYRGGPAAPKPPSTTAIVPLRPKYSPAGYHVGLQQKYQDVPLHGGIAVVHMTKQHRVHFFTNDLTKDLPDLDVTDVLQKGINQFDAVDAVAKELRLKRPAADLRIKLAIVPRDKSWRLAWRVDVALAAAAKIYEEADRSGNWRAFVDVETGDLIGELLDITTYAGGQGRVFHPNPVVALKNNNMTANDPIPQEAYQDVELSRLDNSGYLRGRYADTHYTDPRVHEPDRAFIFDRSHPGFEEVMAYYFVDQVMAWVGRLGWPNLFEHLGPLGINAHDFYSNSSKFVHSEWALNLSDNSVNDAEDASIIIHELGHAIQYAQGWGACDRDLPVRAMGEGFSDWLAAVYFAEERLGFNTGWVGDWDARGYRPPGDYLRRVTENKTMDDWGGDEHQDGEIWSAALWDLFLEMGGNATSSSTRKKARSSVVKLVLQSHHYLSDGNRVTLKFEDGAEALLNADQFLSEDPITPGPYEQLIRNVFVKRGILP